METAPARSTLQAMSRALVRGWKLALLTFLVTLSLGGLAWMWVPRTYQSEAKLFIRVGRESVGVDPIITTSAMLSVYETRETEINSVLEMLRSRALLERVVDEIGVAEIVERPVDESPVMPVRFGSLRPDWMPPRPAVTQQEQAIDALERRLEIWAPRRSSVICIRCKAPDPYLAQRIIATLLEQHEAEHLRLTRTPGSHEFFESQTRLIETQLNDIAGTLREAQNALPAGSVEGERKLVEARLESAEQQRAQVESESAATQARAEALRGQLRAVPEYFEREQTRGMPHLATDTIRTDLYKLEVQLGELESRYTDNHPLLHVLRKQVQQAEDVFRQQAPERTQATRTINNIHQELQAALLAAESNLESLHAQLRELKQQRENLRSRLAFLNEQEVRIQDLRRQRDVLDASYRLYAEKREQSRVDAALQQERITNISVVQPASFAAKPSSPRTLLFALLALVAATSGAVGTCVLSQVRAGAFGGRSSAAP
jgi:polysaccharide biosynthesis protein PslE